MIRSIFIFASLLILLSSACQKEEPGFTNDAGNSTVSAQLNGQDWFASAEGVISSNRQDSFDVGFYVYKNGLLREVLSLITVPMVKGEHRILNRMDEEIRNSLRPSYAGYNTFLADGDLIGEWWDSSADTVYNFCIVDRVDMTNRIIEGRFQVMLVKDPSRDFFDTPDTLRFENGRFTTKLK